MTDKKKDKEGKAWEKGGVSPNSTGRPPLPENASDLRAMRGHLRRLSPKAIKLIEQSLNGETESSVSKEQVNTSKWVVNTLVVVHKAVVAEEGGPKITEEDEKEEKVDVPSTRARLSLVMAET